MDEAMKIPTGVPDGDTDEGASLPGAMPPPPAPTASRAVTADDRRLRRYLKSAAPSVFVRLGLTSQMQAMADWPAALRSEPEATLQALGAQVEGELTVGRAAEAQRVTAAGERATHRARQIDSLVDDLNALRATTLGRLIQRGTKNKCRPDWARRFFMKTKTSASSTDDALPVPEDGEAPVTKPG